MDITLPQEQQDWLNAEIAVSRFSSVDEAIAAAVASYMAGRRADANSALDEFRRELRRSMADPSGWRMASPLSHRSTVVASDAELEDLTARGHGDEAPGYEAEAEGGEPDADPAPRPQEAGGAVDEGCFAGPAECGGHEPEEKTAITSLSADYGAPEGIEMPEPRSKRSE